MEHSPSYGTRLLGGNLRAAVRRFSWTHRIAEGSKNGVPVEASFGKKEPDEYEMNMVSYNAGHHTSSLSDQAWKLGLCVP